MIAQFQLGLAVSAFIAGFAWIRTGRSPFWLGAMALIWLEAVRLEAWNSFWPAARIFARRVQRRFALVKAQIGATA